MLKGLNAAEQGEALRGMWDTFHDPVAVGLDASRFDQHVSEAALRWEHSVYLDCFRGEHAGKLRRLLEWQIRNVGRAYTGEAKIKYTVNGCRMSGDINTSLGNCLIMCALVWEWCRQRGINARLANNGDDCVVVMDRAQLTAFQDGLEAWFLGMGFEMEVEAPVTTFEEIVFCQTQPVWTPSGWLMVRQVDVAISKDLVTLLSMPQSYNAYVGAIGECGLAAYGGVPIFQEFYRSLLAAGKPSKLLGETSMAMGLRHLSEGMTRSYQAIHPQTRASFALAFGVLPDEQTQLEGWLRHNPVPTKPEQRLTTPASFWYK